MYSHLKLSKIFSLLKMLTVGGSEKKNIECRTTMKTALVAGSIKSIKYIMVSVVDIKKCLEDKEALLEGSNMIFHSLTFARSRGKC